MTRRATEVVVRDGVGPLRIVNLHLEFHSILGRLAQVGSLRELHREVLEKQKLPLLTDAVGPYQSVTLRVTGCFGVTSKCYLVRRSTSAW